MFVKVSSTLKPCKGFRPHCHGGTCRRGFLSRPAKQNSLFLSQYPAESPRNRKHSLTAFPARSSILSATVARTRRQPPLRTEPPLTMHKPIFSRSNSTPPTKYPLHNTFNIYYTLFTLKLQAPGLYGRGFFVSSVRPLESQCYFSRFILRLTPGCGIIQLADAEKYTLTGWRERGLPA